MARAAAQISSPEIPDKLYFRIGEVSRLVGVKPYVLRYWETEFPDRVPKKSGTGQRLYRRKDVENLLEIKHLLYDRKFTIEGARQHLRQRLVVVPGPAPRAVNLELFPAERPASTLEEIRRELREILALLD
jgi:DNA-binding transcriptional MerR regulator